MHLFLDAFQKAAIIQYGRHVTQTPYFGHIFVNNEWIFMILVSNSMVSRLLNGYWASILPLDGPKYHIFISEQLFYAQVDIFAF